MKRAGYLMSKIATVDNLCLAFWKASRGARGSAVDRFSGDPDRSFGELAAEIQSGTVPVGQYTRFVVMDPKRRVIHAACFRERVLHHAIMNICGAHFERGAIPQSFACRIGRGNRSALDHACRCSRRARFFLKMDVRKYFDSVDHARLKARFRRLFKDPDLLRLLDRIVDSYETSPGRGLPIGTLTSQYFANFHLDPLDRFVKELLGCRLYARYMDDFALWHDSRAQLEEWREAIERFLDMELGLAPKDGTRIARTSEGMEFLGFRVLRGRMLLGRRARRRFRVRLRACQCAADAGRIGQADLQRRVDSLLAFVNQAECGAWRRAVMAASESRKTVDAA